MSAPFDFMVDWSDPSRPWPTAQYAGLAADTSPLAANLRALLAGALVPQGEYYTNMVRFGDAFAAQYGHGALDPFAAHLRGSTSPAGIPFYQLTAAPVAVAGGIAQNFAVPWANFAPAAPAPAAAAAHAAPVGVGALAALAFAAFALRGR